MPLQFIIETQKVKLFTIKSMSSISQAEQQQLVQLANITFQSDNTEMIKQAANQAVGFMISKYPKSFTKVEQLITKKQRLPINTRKALVNLYKTATEQIKCMLEKETFASQEVLSSHKQLLFAVQHAFDNNKIEAEIKHPISVCYVDIFVLFNAENFQRLISKAKYNFNIKEDALALSLLQSYHFSTAPFKYKVQFYQPCLRTLLIFLQKKVNVLVTGQEVDQTFTSNLFSHVALLQQIWTSLNFQMYQSVFLQEIKQERFIYLLSTLTSTRFPQALIHQVLDITEHIVSGLVRCKLTQHNPKLTLFLKQLAVKQFQSFIEQFSSSSREQNQDLKLSKLKFLISCFDCTFSRTPFIEYNISIPFLFQKLIQPNFKNIQAYLHRHSHNITEIFSFLDDLSYQMKSECSEILIHKLILTICKSSNDLLIGARILISSFLFSHLSIISSGEIEPVKTIYQLHQGVQFWNSIKQLNQKQTILNILQFTASSVSLFFNDFQFLADLNAFAGVNCDFLFQKDPEIAFYSLALYQNYKEDIFVDNRSSGFKMHLLHTALKGENPILKQFSLLILQDELNKKPPYGTIFLTVQLIFKSMLEIFSEDLFPLVLTIFKHYSPNLQKIKHTLPLITRTFQILSQRINDNYSFCHLNPYFEIISSFLSIKSLAHHFPDLLISIIQLASKISYKSSLHGDEFLSIIVKGLNVLQQLPSGTQQVLMQFKWQFQNIDNVNNFTDLLQYTSNPTFSNYLLQRLLNQQFNIYNCLLIHSIIYYKGRLINPNLIQSLVAKIYKFRTINRKGVNFINGKLNIILLMLIKCDRSLLHSILMKQHWLVLVEQTNQLLRAQQLLEKKHQFVPFIDEIYQLLYIDQHIYHWQYDLEVFLILQLSIMLNELQEPYQLKYANVAFVSVLKNVLRAYELIPNSQELNQSQSDDQQLFPKKQFNRDYVINRQTMNKYHLPKQFKQDYFLLFQQLIQKLKSHLSSEQWLKIILNSVLDEQDLVHLHQIINSVRCGDKSIRRILKVLNK